MRAILSGCGEIRGRASPRFAALGSRGVAVTIEVGVESDGCIAGEPLAGGRLLRIGVSVRIKTE